MFAAFTVAAVIWLCWTVADRSYFAITALLMWGCGDAAAALGISFGKYKVNLPFCDGKKIRKAALQCWPWLLRWEPPGLLWQAATLWARQFWRRSVRLRRRRYFLKWGKHGECACRSLCRAALVQHFYKIKGLLACCKQDGAKAEYKRSLYSAGLTTYGII